MTKSEMLFVVRSTATMSATDTGVRVAKGVRALGSVVAHMLPDGLSESSRETMRAILEQDDRHVREMFAGKSGVRLYQTNSRAVDVMLATGPIQEA